ncbi:MAG: metalloregulator ArsR/SmtB family transcription factor [Streptosporangiaceae bacterium]
MARAATTTDAFNAVAEPRRRQILAAIAASELSVTELVGRLGLPQPLVSKHLRVLRETELVVVRDEGRQRLYRLNGPALKPIYDWVRDFEQLWSERFGRMDIVLAELKAEAGETHESRAGTEDDDGTGHDDQLGGGDTPQRHGDPHHQGV